jgi:putative ABC transport system permease protein
VAQYFQTAVERIKQVHGVTSAAAISWLPLSGLGSATDFRLGDRPEPPAGQRPVADVRTITPDYFRTMGIAMLKGRTFDPALDHADDAVKKVIVNQATVDLYWPGQNPIGKTIRMEWYTDLQAEVIGVVSNVRAVQVDTPTTRAMLYWYVPQFANDFMTIVARTDGDPTAIVADAKEQLRTLDPNIPVANIRTMQDVVSRSLREPRFSTVLLGIFAGLALVLAAIGLYGVVSYSVTQRQHELGIRMALGARPAEIWRMVIRQGLGLTMTGAMIGFVVALFLARFLSTMVYGVSTHDAVTFGLVPLVIVAVAAIACYLPARRATRVDPMIALRYE